MVKMYECVICGGPASTIRIEKNKEGKKIKRAICDNCWRILKTNPEKKEKIFKGE